MPISKLPQRTSTLINSTRRVPSFEAAVISVLENSLLYGARHVQITILPAALRFTVSDDGPGIHQTDWHLILQPGCTSTPDAPGQSLSSLAAVASVELHTQCGAFRASKLMRVGRLLESSECARAHPGLSGDGVVVDVWEIFAEIPVRRRVELEKDTARVVRAVREGVVALSLANPKVGVTLSGENGVLYFKSVPRERLTVDMIQVAFGDAHGLEWQSVRGAGRGGFRVAGFVARRGCGHRGMQFVSVNKIPVIAKGWIHRIVRKAWVMYLAQCAREDGGRNKLPAYVLNCSGSSEALGVLSAQGKATHLLAASQQLEDVLLAVLQSALIGQTTASRSEQTPKMSSQMRISFPVIKKRGTTPFAGMFSDALICKRVLKPPASRWSSSSVREVLKRPLSEGSRLESRHAGGQLSRPSRICIRRPSTADAVEKNYKKNIPNWANPCFQPKPQVSRKAVAVPEGESHVNRMFEKTPVTIRRDTIKQLRVVGQVDDKFIMVVDRSAVIYAVDQHAASERFVYETLLRKTIPARIQPSTLQTPLRVTLSHSHMETATRMWRELQQWGWTLRTGVDKSSLEVIQVPQIGGLDVILDDEGHLRNYLDDMLGGAVKNATPRPIMEAVASAACHSAVRFGDVLSRKQCESLVWSLAECSSPFLCAHGRPSIVPLAVFEDEH